MADNTINTSASGLKVAERRLERSAKNITTPDKSGLINSATLKKDDPGNKDIVEESIKMIEASASAKANAKSIRAGDEMLGKVINIKS